MLTIMLTLHVDEKTRCPENFKEFFFTCYVLPWLNLLIRFVCKG